MPYDKKKGWKNEQFKKSVIFYRGGGSFLTGFTMAEILLSLTIIGVVAAITLPSLTGNINERTWNTQRKALYARMSQAVALMPALGGYGTLTEETSSGADDAVDTAAETFLTEGLSKVLKINNICDYEHLEDCGIVNSFVNIAGSQMATPTTLYELSSLFQSAVKGSKSYSTEDTKAVAFETQNGESIIAYYNRNCMTEYSSEDRADGWGQYYGFPQTNMCVNFIYDLNGNKGPNTVGKDIGIMTVFNSIDAVVVAPLPSTANDPSSGIWENASGTCKAKDSESRLPNIDELSAMMINKNLFNMTGTRYWSGTVYDSGKSWVVWPVQGYRATEHKYQGSIPRCIKR